MVKTNFYQFKRKQNSDGVYKTVNGKNVYKYSGYMQSRDSNWLNRNIRGNQTDINDEPIEEDIRD